MGCYHHPSEQAVATCSECEVGICKDCYDSYGDSETVLCFDCTEQAVLNHGNMVAAFKSLIQKERKNMMIAASIFGGILAVFCSIYFHIFSLIGAALIVVWVFVIRHLIRTNKSEDSANAEISEGVTQGKWKLNFHTAVMQVKQTSQQLKTAIDKFELPLKIIVITLFVASFLAALPLVFAVAMGGWIGIGWYGTYSFIHRIGGNLAERLASEDSPWRLLGFRPVAFFLAMLLGALTALIPYYIAPIYIIGRLRKQKKQIDQADEILLHDARILQRFRDYFVYTQTMEENPGVDLASLADEEGGTLFENTYARAVLDNGEKNAQEGLRAGIVQIAANGEIIRSFEDMPKVEEKAA